MKLQGDASGPIHFRAQYRTGRPHPIHRSTQPGPEGASPFSRSPAAREPAEELFRVTETAVATLEQAEPLSTFFWSSTEKNLEGFCAMLEISYEGKHIKILSLSR